MVNGSFCVQGCETMEPEGMRQQFPYYNELQSIFNARMQRMLWMEAEGGSSSGSKKKPAMALSSEDEEENEDSEGEAKSISRKKRKVKGGGGGGGNSPGSGNIVNSLREILEDFMKQQVQMEVQWMKAVEAREEERRIKEMEWRQTMEALENERVMMERRWREREEQRRAREEARAEKRDTLITALLNKLRREDL